MTFYIIDGRTIINAVETDSPERALAVARSMVNGERLTIDAYPPMPMLQKYRYWNERP